MVWSLGLLCLLAVAVRAAPSFEPGYDGKSSVWEGESFAILCRIPVHQAPQLQWSKNGMIFVPSERAAFLEYEPSSVRHPSLLMNTKPRGNEHKLKTASVGKPLEYVIEESITENHEEGQFLLSKLTIFTAKLSDSGTYRCMESSHVGHSLMVLTDSPQVDDFEGDTTQVVKVGYPFHLYCNVTKDPVNWFKDDDEIVKTDRINIDIVHNTLSVPRSKPEDGGKYECKTSDLDTKKEFIVHVEPHIKFATKSVNAIFGEKFELKCEATGFPVPELTWTKDNLPINLSNATSHYVFEDDKDIKNAVLKIENLVESDEGDYACFGESVAGSANSTVLVRVKDKWAALYPFLGIVAEVIILVAIIFIYEKRRSKQRKEDNEDDQGKDKNSVNNKDADVRQRK